MDDSRDDGIPIRRHTKRRTGPPAWVRPFLLAFGCGAVGALLFAGLVMAVRPRDGGGYFVAPQPTNNARCPACAKEWRISEEFRDNPSGMMRTVPCPRCHFASPPVYLYAYYDKARQQNKGANK
jgi:hypothetical protein